MYEQIRILQHHRRYEHRDTCSSSRNSINNNNNNNSSSSNNNNLSIVDLPKICRFLICTINIWKSVTDYIPAILNKNTRYKPTKYFHYRIKKFWTFLSWRPFLLTFVVLFVQIYLNVEILWLKIFWKTSGDSSDSEKFRLLRRIVLHNCRHVLGVDSYFMEFWIFRKIHIIAEL